MLGAPRAGPSDAILGEIREALFENTLRKEDIYGKFVKFATLKEIWSWSRLDAFFKGRQWCNKDVLKTIRKQFLRTLSVLVYIRFDDWEHFCGIFLLAKDEAGKFLRDDARLPFENLHQLHFLSKEEYRQRFHADQYTFNPVKICHGQSAYYDTTQRLPFEDLEQFDSGASSTILKATIAQGHWIGADGAHNSEVCNLRFKQLSY